MTDLIHFNAAQILAISAKHFIDASPGGIKVKNMKSDTQLKPDSWLESGYQPGIARAAERMHRIDNR
jgi:hypothetical protein